MKYVLHVIPDSVNNEKKLYLGSTKDVRSRSQYFADRNIKTEEYISLGRSDENACEMLRNRDLTDCAAVIFEFETYPLCLKFLKERYPKIVRISRAINANLPHFIDQYRGRSRMINDGLVNGGCDPLDELRQGLKRYQTDLEVVKYSDYLLSITEWETNYYWKKFPKSCNIITVPYFIPPQYSIKFDIAHTNKNLFVCFMGTAGLMSPLLYDAGKNTVDIINSLPKNIVSNWVWCITGQLKPINILGELGPIMPVGRVKDPYLLLSDAKIVSILSDLGMGFKTKILEAVEAGCWVFVTKNLYARLPVEVLSSCCIVDPNSTSSFIAALKKCSSFDPPENNANENLKNSAYKALDDIFKNILDINHYNITSGVKTNISSIALHGLDNIERTKKIPPYLSPIYAQSKDEFSQVINPVIKQYFSDVKNPVLLEFGVGVGGMLRAAGKQGYKCVGVDYSLGLTQFAKENVSNALYIGPLSDNNMIPWGDGSIDLAYSQNHFLTIDDAIKANGSIVELNRVLRPNGFLVIRIRRDFIHPHEANFCSRLKFLSRINTFIQFNQLVNVVRRKFKTITDYYLELTRGKVKNSCNNESLISRMLTDNGFKAIRNIPSLDTGSVWILYSKI